LQDRGHSVALVTDGRMSGASGKVPAAIQLVPEALTGGLLAKVRDGDMVRVDANTGDLTLLGDIDSIAARPSAPCPTGGQRGCGRELFIGNRAMISDAEQGASFLFPGV
jgi:phosphogluconate dehydratase